MAVEDSVAQDQLRAFIERIERMEEEKAGIAADIKEIYAEAKGNGFDTKILRKIVTIRKQDTNERIEQEALLDLYMGALGMGDVSGAYSANRRNSVADEIDDDLLTTVAETAKTPEGRKALMDAVAAHKSGSKLSQLRADPAMATVDAAKIPPKPEQHVAHQPASDLTSPQAPQGQVAPLSEPAREGGSQSQEAAGTGRDAAAPSSGEAQRTFSAPGEIVWETHPPEGVERSPISIAFGNMGQDAAVIADDLEKGRAQPIVKKGKVILDGWCRYMTARDMRNLDGSPVAYPVVQYDGHDLLTDIIKLNVEGWMLTEQQKRLIAANLTRQHPSRKEDIYRAFELFLEPV